MAKKAIRRVNSRADRYLEDTYEDGSAVQETFGTSQRRGKCGTSTTKSQQTDAQESPACNADEQRICVLSGGCMCRKPTCMCEFSAVKVQLTTQNEAIVAAESKLSKLKADNDAYYNTVMASVSMDTVKEAALNRLGLKYRMNLRFGTMIRKETVTYGSTRKFRM